MALDDTTNAVKKTVRIIILLIFIQPLLCANDNRYRKQVLNIFNVLYVLRTNILHYAVVMTVSFTIDLEQNVVFTQVDGIQLREHQERLDDDSDFKADMYELMDCSEIINVKMKTINNSQLAKSSPWGSDAKRAIVVPNLLIFGFIKNISNRYER